MKQWNIWLGGWQTGISVLDPWRNSGNLFWSPTPRIDVGAEYLWGRRENENGEEGDAAQLQMMTRYRF